MTRGPAPYRVGPGPATARIGVDVGGTFTDLVAADGAALEVRKVPSTPDAPDRAVWTAVDRVGSDRARAATLIHGTTVATNALLTRTGARVVLVTTAGFEDLLELRRQDRAALYDLARHHPPPLVPRERVVGAAERMGPLGVVRPLSEEAVGEAVDRVRRLSPEAVAVSLLFGFLHSEHERRLVAALAAAMKDVPVIAASELVPRIREYERTSTVCAEAFLRPGVGAYLERLAEAALERRVGSLRVMASNGGALDAKLAATRTVFLALSGPAGGVLGAARIGAACGRGDLLTLDMGGTSADASLVRDGASEFRSEGVVADLPLAVPHTFIETVSAGGGSIGWLDSGGALRVGPQSAGAEPGPACYGRGGRHPTLTDACVVLGWIAPDARLGGTLPLQPRLAEQAVGALGRQMGLAPHEVALGMARVAEAAMARALRRVSAERGIDPSGFSLLAFGGAGPLFACSLARLLGVREVIVPPLAGALSAWGMAGAADRVEATLSVHLSTRDFEDRASELARLLARRLEGELPGAKVAFLAQCRYRRQGYELEVSADPRNWKSVTSRFHAAHLRRFAHRHQGATVEVINLRAVASGRPRALPAWRERSGERRGAAGRRRITLASGETEAHLVPRELLASGDLVGGPAVVEGSDSTALVLPGWAGVVHRSGALILEGDGAGTG